MIVGVLAIQGAVSEHIKLLTACRVEAKTVKTAEDLAQVSGLIIPGGESTTIGKLIKLFNLEEPIRERSSKRDLAVFGTCAGMVLMANNIEDGIPDQPKLAIMDISIKRNAFGRQRESFETDLSFISLTEPFPGVFIRAPIITEAGEAVSILSRLPEGIVAARQENLLVTSFHPGLTGDLRIHHYFIDLCKGL